MGSRGPKGKGWWAAVIGLLGVVLVFLAPIGVGLREIARNVPNPTNGESAQIKQALAAALQVSAQLTTTTQTQAGAPAPVNNDARTSGTVRNDSPRPRKRGSVQECVARMNEHYQAYLNYQKQKTPEQLKKMLDGLQKQRAFLAKESWDLVNQKKMTGIDLQNMLRFYQLLETALELETFVLENDWEGGAYYCRRSVYRWETELYFLKQMGPRGYFMILKRAPQRLWGEYRRGKVYNQNPRY